MMRANLLKTKDHILAEHTKTKKQNLTSNITPKFIKSTNLNLKPTEILVNNNLYYQL